MGGPASVMQAVDSQNRVSGSMPPTQIGTRNVPNLTMAPLIPQPPQQPLAPLRVAPMLIRGSAQVSVPVLMNASPQGNTPLYRIAGQVPTVPVTTRVSTLLLFVQRV